jgi:hypothetical protein
MAIIREKFLVGEEFGTFKEVAKKCILKFLNENANKAYTSFEITSKVSIPLALGGMAISISELDELVEEGKIICKKVGKKLYYATI